MTDIATAWPPFWSSILLAANQPAKANECSLSQEKNGLESNDGGCGGKRGTTEDVSTWVYPEDSNTKSIWQPIFRDGVPKLSTECQRLVSAFPSLTTNQAV